MCKNKQTKATTKVCPECHTHHIHEDHQRGEIVCRTCGLVLRASYHQYGVVFPGMITLPDKNKHNIVMRQ